ncbi:hypothetical protein TNCV_460981 [Trichonephila clavipes]|nr:hypothetical protein TNCV_460981 [Trichonephila clavipes]
MYFSSFSDEWSRDLKQRGNPSSVQVQKQRSCRVYYQVDGHVDPGKCPAVVSSEKKTRPSSYGVLPSPAELGYERTDVVFFFIF